jgi:geranyl-CoA carboxylase alpha subunit
MIAKLVAHGRTRDEARRRLVHGLQDLVALGVRTNQAFLLRCLAHPVFAAGAATTAFIGEHQVSLLQPDADAGQRVAAIAAALLLDTAPGAQRGASRRLQRSIAIGLRLQLDGGELQALVRDEGGHQHAVRIGDRQHRVHVVHLDGHHARVICDEVMDSVAYVRDGARLLVSLAGQAHEVLDTTRAATVRAAGPGGDGRLRASMNGRVVAVLVDVGQPVQAGQALVTLEAMKMEHVHAAPRSGTVTALHVAVGDQVGAGRIVVEIEGD